MILFIACDTGMSNSVEHSPVLCIGKASACRSILNEQALAYMPICSYHQNAALTSYGPWNTMIMLCAAPY